MKPLNYLRTLAIFLSLLVISLPITFAEEFNRAYDGDGNLISDGKYYGVVMGSPLIIHH